MDPDNKKQHFVRFLVEDESNRVFDVLTCFLSPWQIINLVQISRNFRFRTLKLNISKKLLELAKIMKTIKPTFLEYNYGAVLLGIIEYFKVFINNNNVVYFFSLAYSLIFDLFVKMKNSCLRIDFWNLFFIRNDLRFLYTNLPNVQTMKVCSLHIDPHLSNSIYLFLRKRPKLKKIVFKNLKVQSTSIILPIVEGLYFINTVKELTFSENYLSKKCGEHLIKFFRNNFFLSKVVMKDNLMEDFEGYTLSLFQNASEYHQIRVLIYENQEMDESLFSEVVPLIAKSSLKKLSLKLFNSRMNSDLVAKLLLSKNLALEDFDISSSNIGYAYLKNIIQILFNSKNQTGTFKKINIGRLFLTLDFKENFVTFLKNCKFGSLGFYDHFTELNKEIYVESIFKNPDLTDLDLSKSVISYSNFDFLKYIFFHKTLTRLSLRECGLTEENLYYFSLAFSDMVSLQYLDLSFNKLSASSASHLCDAILSSRSLEHFDLSQNWLGFQSLIMILYAVFHSKCISKLIFQNNFYDIDQVEKINIEEIKKVIKKPKKCKLQCNDCENTVFTTLDISTNFINENLLRKLAILIKQFQGFKSLIMKNCYVTPQALLINQCHNDFAFVYCLDPASQEHQLLNQKLPYWLYLKAIEFFEANSNLDVVL